MVPIYNIFIPLEDHLIYIIIYLNGLPASLLALDLAHLVRMTILTWPISLDSRLEPQVKKMGTPVGERGFMRAAPATGTRKAGPESIPLSPGQSQNN